MNSSRRLSRFSPLDTRARKESQCARAVRAQKLRSFVSAAICNSAYNNNYSFESVALPLPPDDWFRLFIGSLPALPIFCFATLKLSRPLRDFLPLLYATRTEYIKINICSRRTEQSRSLTDTRVLHTMRCHCSYLTGKG